MRIGEVKKNKFRTRFFHFGRLRRHIIFLTAEGMVSTRVGQQEKF